jgi:TonB family protein
VDAVSPILIDRAREPQGLRQMITLSLIVHAVGTAGLLFLPSPQAHDTAPESVMTISLSGTMGERHGGMTTIAGRTAEAAPEAKPAPAQAVAKLPEMVLPTITKNPVAPPKPVKQAPDDAHAKAVPKAAEASSGDARIETAGRTTGFGLTKGGGGGASGYLDVANFCCPEYLSTMIQLIQRNWNGRQDVAGQTMMKFTIQRDGRLTDVQMEQSSGYFALDQTAQRALLTTRQLPPLPPAFSEPVLTVHLNFKYEH